MTEDAKQVARLHGPHDIRVTDEPMPVPGLGEVLLRVTSVGLQPAGTG